MNTDCSSKRNLQVICLKFLGKEKLSAQSRFYLSLLVCVNLRGLSFIISNTDIDYPSSHLPTSAPIASVLNVCLDSVGVGMNVACEIPLNLFAIMLMLTLIHLNFTVGQVEGTVQGAVDISSYILAGSCLLQISIFYF